MLRFCRVWFFLVLPQVAQARNMSIGEHRHCCATFEYKDLYNKYKYINLYVERKSFTKCGPTIRLCLLMGINYATPSCYLPSQQFSFRPVNCDEVQKVITLMPSDKAPGIDKISIRVIKHSLPAILPSVTSIINESLASNTFPIEWKTAEVIPVLKEGDHEKPNNYRPISLLPVLSKLCERIALNQLMPYLVENDRLSAHQSGNRKCYYSTIMSFYHIRLREQAKYEAVIHGSVLV